MSLFLGKIHFWLYNKILWYEEIEDKIIDWAEKKRLPVDEWTKTNIENYGKPTGGKPLEEVVDKTNIHGWLQERIDSVELRQASLVTNILQENPEYISELIEIFKEQGLKAGQEYGENNLSPEETYGVLNNYILEGMPCDRVELQLSSTKDEYAWKITRCLHKSYWDKASGDVNVFYQLRGAWVKAFVEALNSQLSYEWSEENVHRIFHK